MKKVIVFGASNSKNSINKKLAVYAASQLKDVAVQVLDLNDYNLPIYGIDTEIEQGIHPEAKKFYDDLQTADAYIISFAEHNGSYTVAFKNVFDWTSRINAKVWRNKPVLLLATSPGARGGKMVLDTAVNSFPHFGASVIGSFSLPAFPQNFVDGKIGNQDLQKELRALTQKLQNAL